MPKGFPGSQGQCSVDECLITAAARSFCGTHYGRWRRHGDPLTITRASPGEKIQNCTACGRPAEAVGLCHTHYRRQRRNGNLDIYRVPPGSITACTAGGCANTHKARGLCDKHYQKATYNPQVKAGQARRYYAKHADIAKANRRRRQARERGAEGQVTGTQWQALVFLFGHLCAYCRQRFENPSLDHVVPLIKGGTHEVGNVVPACRPCNSSKGSKEYACA